MSTDYRALCAELEEAYAWCIEEYMTAPAEEDTLIQRARAVLAQPYSDPTEERRLGYLKGLEDCAHAALAQPDPISELVSQCRPLEPEMAEHLTPQARWRLYGDEAQPEPVAPTDEELTLVYAYAVAAAVGNKRGPFKPEDAEAAQLAGLRAVLAKWGNQ